MSSLIQDFIQISKTGLKILFINFINLFIFILYYYANSFFYSLTEAKLFSSLYRVLNCDAHNIMYI